MISAGKNKNLDRQQTEIAINTRRPPSTDRVPPGRLPYDPNAAPDDANTTIVIAPNYVDNSDFDFSKNGYVASGAGDDDYECFNFYRQRFIKVTDLVTTAASNTVTSASNPFKSTFTYPMDFVLLNGGVAGVALSGFLDRNAADGSAKLYSDAGLMTPLNVTLTLADAVLWFGDSLAENAANALKFAGHSLYAANEGTLDIIPRWDRVHGWSEIGSDITTDSWDIATPLPINFIRAGVTYHFRVLISQRAGTTAGDPVRFYFGIWDATSGQARFLESSNLDLTVGTAGTSGATTYKYRVIADLDDGTEIMSDEVTITTGNASLSTTHYNRLTWENAAGVLNFRIYRETGGVVKRIFTIRNGGHDYNDYGTDEGETPASMPVTSVVRPIAYKVSPEFSLSGEGVWQSALLEVEIPSTYDSSATTGRQWLRIGIEGLASEERIFLLDRVMLSPSNGGWQRSARDLTLIQTVAPTSTPPDDGGQGGGGIDDPPSCFVMDTPMLVCERDGSAMREIEIGSLGADELIGMFVFSGGNRVFKIDGVKDGWTDRVVACRLASGVTWECSPSERFITSKLDKKGTLITELTFGDEISGWNETKTLNSPIVGYKITNKRVKVRTLILKGGKTFCIGRRTGILGIKERLLNKIRRVFGIQERWTKAVAHNTKPGIIEPPTS